MINYLLLMHSILKKTYAKSCGSNRQPMGLSNTKFAKYKANANQYVDNYLTIGENTYFCPRYWCPTSEHPIKNATDKCEKGEETYKYIFNK